MREFSYSNVTIGNTGGERGDAKDADDAVPVDGGDGRRLARGALRAPDRDHGERAVDSDGVYGELGNRFARTT
jgi:hypothetical protein